jgi:hypothetical protein
MPTLIVDGITLEVTDGPSWSPGAQGTVASIAAQVHILASQSITEFDKTNAEVVLDIGHGQAAVGRAMSLVGPPRTNGDRAFLRFEGPAVEVLPKRLAYARQQTPNRRIVGRCARPGTAITMPE